MWRNLSWGEICHVKNFLYVIDFLHISHVEKLLHMTDFFSTSTACGACECDKYQVWDGRTDRRRNGQRDGLKVLDVLVSQPFYLEIKSPSVPRDNFAQLPADLLQYYYRFGSDG